MKSGEYGAGAIAAPAVMKALFPLILLVAVTSGHSPENDWPMWGYNAARTHGSPAVRLLSDTLHLQWVRELPPPRRAWARQMDDADKLEFDLSYTPIVKDGRLFVASMSNDRLTAYDTRSGEELWRFYADGPMRVAPAAGNGTVYVPSDDGKIYCLDAANGTLRWSFQAAPSPHRVLGNERVISMWPVRGGPVLLDSIVYVGAGVWPFVGCGLYALHAESGARVWENTGFAAEWQRQPHGGAYAFAGLAPQGYLAASGERLVVAGGRASPGLFDRRSGSLLFYTMQEEKGSGGYRVGIQDGHYFNHGARFALDDGARNGEGSMQHEYKTLLQSRVASIASRLDAPVFESLTAAGLLFVVTHSGRLYCFGNTPRADTLRYRYRPDTIAAADSDAGRQAERILQHTGIRDGYALVLGTGDGEFLEQLALRSTLHIVAFEPDCTAISAIRRRLDDAGLYGTRVAVIAGRFTQQHYPDYISSLIVARDPGAAGLPADEHTLTRLTDVLLPYRGRAWLGFDPSHRRVRKLTATFKGHGARVVSIEDAIVIQRHGPLSGAGEWTHQHGNAAQTVVSQDYRVRPPFGPIWFGGPSHDNVLPRHAAGPRPQVSGGRVILLGVETISARCVYTGRELWVRDVAGIGHPFTNLDLEQRWQEGEMVYMTNQPGATYIGSPYVSLPDAVYLRYQGRIMRLDPATGETVAEWPLPALAAQQDTPDWGHISVSDDMIITTTSPHIFRGGALGTIGDDSWDGSSSRRLVALDRHTGVVAWTRDALIGFRHNAIASSGGRLFVTDLLSERAVQMARWGGGDLDVPPRLFCLDIRTGKELWAVDNDVFGTFLSYSEQHDILLEGGTRDGRHHIEDEPTARLVARRGSDGEVVWDIGGSFSGPLILRDDMIIPGRPGAALCLLSGTEKTREHPITGRQIPWAYWKTYGCGSSNASPHLLLFRSGAAGFADLKNDGGTGTLGGFKSGCTANLIAADGVLNAPDYTRTCACSYQNQTSLGLIHMPEMELWTMNQTIGAVDTAIQRIGINLGAPGDRRADNGTLWLHIAPRAPSADITITLKSEDNVTTASNSITAVQGYKTLGMSPEQALDSDLKSAWEIQCLGSGAFRDEWQCELAHPVSLDRVLMAWSGPAATQYRIEASEDIEHLATLELPRDAWRFAVDPDAQGEAQRWFDTAFDDSGWDTISIERPWNRYPEYFEYVGAAWYRRSITLPEKPGGFAAGDIGIAELLFEGVDEMAWVWVNGHFIGAHDLGPVGWNLPFALCVTRALRWGEENRIAVRAKNTGWDGGIWRPVRLRLTRGSWQRVYEGVGSGRGPHYDTCRFEPVTARHVRILFGEHGDSSVSQAGRRLSQSLSVYELRIGDLVYPDAYAAFKPRSFFRVHSLSVDATRGVPWVAASGMQAIRELVLRNVKGNGDAFALSLHFMEYDELPAGKRRFDIRVGEQTVVRNFDIVKAAGGARRAFALSLPAVRIEDDLKISFLRSDGSAYPPLLSGLELRREK